MECDGKEAVGYRTIEGKSTSEEVCSWFRAALAAQMLKNPPAMWETWAQSLSWEKPLEEGMATHSNALSWRIPMDRGAWRAAVHGVSETQTGLSNWTQHNNCCQGLLRRKHRNLVFSKDRKKVSMLGA